MRWKILPKKSDDLLEQLLINRGIKTEQEKTIFLHPQVSNFSKDLKILGITKAHKRIKQAIAAGELIVIYGDYDVDGICGSAVLYKALSAIGAKVLPYIPHREKEGYGMSKIGLDNARNNGAGVVISVDNGIVALEQAKYAKNLGLDLVITDHHQPLEKKPDSFVTIHSTKMCGAAVAWCLIKDLIGKQLAQELLQFVAIATVCDMMPLVDLNRAFVYEGLKILNRTENPGLLALFKESGITVGEIDTQAIGFMIGPRLNAIGRLEHAIDALRLLCTKEPKKAKDLARLLCESNSKRQLLTDSAVEEAKLRIDLNKRIHVLSSKNWQPGIIGLIASRVADISYRPAIAISLGETFSKGSARSVDGINIVEIIRQCSDLLLDVGGHPGAAGFSIENSKLEQFKLRMEKISLKFAETVEKVLQIEAKVELGKLTKKLAEQLEDFAPYGFGNQLPILSSFNVKLSDLRLVGAEGKHLKGRVDGMEFIAFGLGSLKENLQNGQTANIAYQLEINKFNGSEILQLKVKDIVSTKPLRSP